MLAFEVPTREPSFITLLQSRIPNPGNAYHIISRNPVARLLPILSHWRLGNTRRLRKFIKEGKFLGDYSIALHGILSNGKTVSESQLFEQFEYFLDPKQL